MKIILFLTLLASFAAPGLRGQDLSATAVAAPPSCHNGNDGTITVTAQNGVPPYGYSFDEFGEYQSSNVFTGLVPGNYEVFVEDQAGFLFILNVTVPNPPPVQVNLQNVATTFCDGGGAWTFAATGGTGSGYTFAINGGPFQYSSGQTITGVESGQYEVYARDANGCEGVTTLTVTRLPSIYIDLITTVTPSCNISDGQIRVLSVINEGNSVVYRLNNGPFQPFNAFIGLAPGTYTLTIRNEHGCTDVAEVVLPDPALAINVAANVTPLSCFDSGDGVIHAVVTSGGLPPYLYSIDGVDFYPSGFFNELTDGEYLIFVQDGAGCMRIVEATVPSPAPLVPAPVVTHAQCGQNNGSVVLNAVGGTPPFAFEFNGGVYPSPTTVSGVAPGEYDVAVTDANGCTAYAFVVVYGVIDLDGETTILQSPACPGVNNGSVSIVVGNPAAGPYAYSADGINFQSSNVLSGLGAGNLTIIVRAANGCVDLYPLTLQAVNTPVVFVEAQNPGCQTADGVVVATVAGAQEPIVYRLNNGPPQILNAFINLAAGQYTLQITDANGCQAERTFSLINEGYFIEDLVINEPVCGAYNDGLIQVVASGGVAPYRYSINGGPFQLNPAFGQLGAGAYVLAVKDATGCMDTMTVVFPFVPPLVIDDVVVTEATCGLANGTIRIVASGGTGQLLFSIDGQPFGPQFEFAELESGGYELGVRDEYGCLAYTTVAVPSVGFPLDVQVTEPECGGSPTGSLTVVAQGGAPPFEYLLQRELTSLTSPDGHFTGLVPATYVLTVTDASGCATVRIVEVGTGNFITVGLGLTNATGCLASDGSISLSASGGAGGYHFSLNGGPFGDSGDFAGLLPGEYTFAVRDAGGCEVTGTAFVGSPVEILLDGTVTNPACGGVAGGSIQIVVSGGQAPYTFAWSDGATQRDRTGLRAGEYSVVLTDANGCPAQRTFALAEPPVLRISAAEVSPGTWKATATGGTPPYLFALNSALFQSDSLFSELDLYNVFYVRDANNCSATDTVNFLSRNGGLSPDFRVYPNPNHGEFTLSVNEFSLVEIGDWTGKLLWRQSLHPGDNAVALPATAKGMLWLKISAGKKTAHAKLWVE